MPTAQALRQGHDVRGDAELLGRKPRTGPAKAGLDLVEDQERTDPGREVAKALEERRWRRNVATLAEHRLDEDRGDVLRRNVMLEHRFDRRERMLAAGFGVVRRCDDAVERVGIRRDVDLGEQRAIAAPVRRLRRGDRGRAHGAPMEAAAEDDDPLTAGDLASKLDRSLDRLGAAVPEEDLIETGRGDLHQRLGKGDVRLVGGDPGADVRELRGLVADRPHHLRMGVAHRGHRDTAGEIEDLPAVAGVQPAPLAPVDLKPAVVAEDRREDPLRARLQRRGRSHIRESLPCAVCARRAAPTSSSRSSCPA